jgi:hypothetical protein
VSLLPYLAVVLIVALALAHSYLGERCILMRLFKRDDLPKVFGSAEFTMGTLRFVWHLISVAWFGIAAVIVQASAPSFEARTVLQTFGAVAAISGLLPLCFTRARHLSWIVFFVVAALLGWASMHQPSANRAASHAGSVTMPTSVDTVTSPATNGPSPPMRTAST